MIWQNPNPFYEIICKQLFRKILVVNCLAAENLFSFKNLFPFIGLQYQSFGQATL